MIEQAAYTLQPTQLIFRVEPLPFIVANRLREAISALPYA
jgi:hypothetical protein